MRKSDITFPFMSLKIKRRDVRSQCLHDGLQPAVTFIKLHAFLKTVAQIRPSRIPLIVAVSCTARTHTDNNGRGPVSRKVGHPRSRIIFGSMRFESRHDTIWPKLSYFYSVLLCICSNLTWTGQQFLPSNSVSSCYSIQFDSLRNSIIK